MTPVYISGTMVGVQPDSTGAPGQNAWVQNTVGRLVLVAKEHLRPAHDAELYVPGNEEFQALREADRNTAEDQDGQAEHEGQSLAERIPKVEHTAQQAHTLATAAWAEEAEAKDAWTAAWNRASKEQAFAESRAALLRDLRAQQAREWEEEEQGF